MLVGERMTNLVLTVSPEESVQEALVSMRKEHIRRFPVVDKKESWSGSYQKVIY